MDELAVIVVAYRAGDDLVRCLDSASALAGIRASIAVVNNDPGDVTPSAVAAEHGGTCLESGGNVGFCAAVNLALRATSSTHVLLLNQDAVVAPDYAARLVESMERDPSIASAGGRLLRAGPDRAHVDSKGLTMGRGRRPMDLGHGDPDDGIRAGVDEVFGVTAAAALYRRSALEAVAVAGAVLPDEYFMYLDDVDLAWRLRLAGYRAVVDHAAVAWHARSAAGDAAGPASGVRRVARTMRVERARPDYVRERSWVNLILTLVRNDDPGPFLRQFGFMAARRLPGDAFGVVQRPAMAARARARLLALLPGALEARREIQGRRVVSAADMARWLP